MPEERNLDFGTPHPEDVNTSARYQPRDESLYRVIVADNYHYRDLDEEYVSGDFATEAEALACCKDHVDASLREHLEPGVTAEGLFFAYKMFGEDPFILGPVGAPAGPRFIAWDYAKARSHELVTAFQSAAGERSREHWAGTPMRQLPTAGERRPATSGFRDLGKDWRPSDSGPWWNRG